MNNDKNKMRFDKFIPTGQLKPYIKYFVVSENNMETEYKIFPSAGLVIGFQYSGQLATIKDKKENKLSSAGITGISDNYKIFRNSPNIGTVLVYFTETGFTHFASHPTNELFNLSISLIDIFDKNKVNEIENKLATSITDKQRIKIVEQFLLSQLKNIQTDKLIIEAVKLIYQSKGTIQVKKLNQKLFISQSPFEKRFRKVVGATPKKFASIIRFNAVLDNLDKTKSLTEICYENNFFDQAHFIKDFKQFTGVTPENFKRFL
jgi:AraC-like DNA-binding protein